MQKSLVPTDFLFQSSRKDIPLSRKMQSDAAGRPQLQKEKLVMFQQSPSVVPRQNSKRLTRQKETSRSALTPSTLPLLLAKLQSFGLSDTRGPNQKDPDDFHDTRDRLLSWSKQASMPKIENGLPVGAVGIELAPEIEELERGLTRTLPQGNVKDISNFPKVTLPLRPHTMGGPHIFPTPVLMVTVKDLSLPVAATKQNEKRSFGGLPPELIPPRKNETIVWETAPKDYYTKAELRFMQKSAQMQINPVIATELKSKIKNDQPLQRKPFLKKRAATAPTRIMTAMNKAGTAFPSGPIAPPTSVQGSRPVTVHASLPVRSKSAYASFGNRFSGPVRPKTPVIVNMPEWIPTRLAKEPTPFQAQIAVKGYENLFLLREQLWVDMDQGGIESHQDSQNREPNRDAEKVVDGFAERDDESRRESKTDPPLATVAFQNDKRNSVVSGGTSAPSSRRVSIVSIMKREELTVETCSPEPAIVKHKPSLKRVGEHDSLDRKGKVIQDRQMERNAKVKATREFREFDEDGESESSSDIEYAVQVVAFQPEKSSMKSPGSSAPNSRRVSIISMGKKEDGNVDPDIEAPKKPSLKRKAAGDEVFDRKTRGPTPGSDRLPRYPGSISRKVSMSAHTKLRRTNSDESDTFYNASSRAANQDSKRDISRYSNQGSRPGSSCSIGTSRFPHAKELGESLNFKLKELGLITLVILLNSALLVLAWALKDGVPVFVSPDAVRYAGGVVLEIVLLVTNIFTIMAMDSGGSIYIACLLTNTKRASIIWIILEAAKLFSPLSATGIALDIVYTDSDPTTCTKFLAADLTDRNYPTVESSMGVGEYIYGTALGCMRSEMDCGGPYSVFVNGPQLNGAVLSGDTIVGDGVQANIRANCKCYNVTSELPVARGLLIPGEGNAIFNFSRDSKFPFLYHGKRQNVSESSFTSVFVLGGTIACGGFSDAVASVCSVEFSELKDVVVRSTFLTDGTTASIALSKSESIGIADIQDLNPDDMIFAMDAMIPKGTANSLPATIPGMLSPLLYWTSTDLLSINPAYLSPGMETTISILLRAGIQRTFDSTGLQCPRFISRGDMTKVKMKGWGYATLFISAVIQLIFSFLALGLAMHWLWNKHPITPALRALRDPTYFMTLLADSPFCVNLVGTANAPPYVFWQSLDLIVKIGESVDTLSEPIGHIKMERAKLVRSLANGRLYY
ncbi:hypothetical protein HDU97_003966 [Phlyctochytrium planicorne]|nr:hypothetical protein HDU97_003966 [Phlyctochytrium planicorne]